MLPVTRCRQHAPGFGRAQAFVLAFAVALFLGACGSSAPQAEQTVDPRFVRVASFDFPESELLAELFAQALEAEDIAVERRFGLGSRELLQPALESGLIDVVPEYLTSSLEFVTFGDLQSDDDVVAAEKLRRALQPRGVTVLKHAPAVDRNALAVRADMAAERGIERISDLAPIAGQLRFVGPPECAERPSCLPTLEDRYGLHFRSFTPVPAGLQIALQLGAKEADVGVAFTTDPLVKMHGLVLLKNDKEIARADNVVPLVRTAALEQRPAIKAALAAATKGLTTDALRELNLRVAEGADPKEVARAWLAR
jgi:osmoprotectant transport system substrate-binding protein